ncbi:SAV_915 family protein [Nocardia farcinica]|uniref:SAV_915 family protein n=1 Tax=Nocardia farcinica TaxID=37329 RepID=UPI002B4B2D76|nr:SAV_915 family protein [Nocardia farcinica]
MLRRTRDGRIACLAYSALDRLLNCCGNNQPWMWTPTVARRSPTVSAFRLTASRCLHSGGAARIPRL